MLDMDVKYLMDTKNVSYEDVKKAIEKVQRIQFLKWWFPTYKKDKNTKQAVLEGDRMLYIIEKGRAEAQGHLIPDYVLDPEFKSVRELLEKMPKKITITI